MTHYITVLSHKDLSTEFFSRLKAGLKITLKSSKNVLVVNSEATQSKLVKGYLENLFSLHKSNRIVFQSKSKDTIGEAVYLKDTYLREGDSVTVVSSDYHINYRAKIIFDFILGSNTEVDYFYVDTDRASDPETVKDQLNSLKFFLDLFQSVDYDDFESAREAFLLNHDLYRELE
jgi:uncharacterized SAM-binding protein YcdF (DUF218 family)